MQLLACPIGAAGKVTAAIFPDQRLRAHESAYACQCVCRCSCVFVSAHACVCVLWVGVCKELVSLCALQARHTFALWQCVPARVCCKLVFVCVLCACVCVNCKKRDTKMQSVWRGLEVDGGGRNKACLLVWLPANCTGLTRSPPLLPPPPSLALACPLSLSLSLWRLLSSFFYVLGKSACSPELLSGKRTLYSSFGDHELLLPLPASRCHQASARLHEVQVLTC